MKKNLITAVLMTIATTILLGIIYPLVVTGIAQVIFPRQVGENAYPAGLCRALAITWLFAGPRVNEIVRLRLGCIRWQNKDVTIPGDTATLPGGSVCMLDVPVNKTSAAFTKPVDPIVEKP
jgi:hypothetical protein